MIRGEYPGVKREWLLFHTEKQARVTEMTSGEKLSAKLMSTR